jgi:hypothetical protein
LFAGGCGKVFGAMADMAQSLDRLASLPEQTEVYCGHEYTLANLRFAVAVDPNNTALLARYRTEQAQRERGMPTLPSTIALEKATNPFLAGARTRHCGSDPHPHRSCVSTSGEILKPCAIGKIRSSFNRRLIAASGRGHRDDR